MKNLSAAHKWQRRKNSAVAAVRIGKMTYRAAAAKFHLPKSTLADYVRRAAQAAAGSNPGLPGRKPAFTGEEETKVVELLCRYADRGLPLTRKHAIEAFTITIAAMPAGRKEKLPFKNGIPGQRFARAFFKRHSQWLTYIRPTKQEAKRFAAVNGETLTTHFAALEKLLQDNDIDPSRLWNLDETGATPGRDASVSTAQRRFVRREGIADMRLPDVQRTHRVTMMPVVSADGDTGPSLFVFKGKTLPYRNVLRAGVTYTETYASLMPCNSIVAVRQKGGGVDSDNFLVWAQHFVQSVRDLTMGDRKVLLTYDGYRSHMSLQVLELFHKNNIIAYALPAHTSGKTQPCDVVLFGAFKQALNTALQQVSRARELDVLDMFDFCSVLRHAYKASFTRRNISASFRRAGLWPLDPTKLLGVPRPRSADDITHVLTISDLEKLMEVKRVLVRDAVLGCNVQVTASGFIDTTHGAVLTSSQALTAAREKARRDSQKRMQERVEASRKALAAVRRLTAEKKSIQRAERARWAVRARLCQLDVAEYRAQVRTLKERRALAKLRKALRDAESVC